MKTLFAFTKKEFTDHLRSGKLTVLGLIFLLFGIMNPAIARLTPWLLEFMSDSLAESGMIITGVTVSAMDSWVQFFKNMPIALIAFVLIESSIFTKEYSSGTLVLSLTKGLARHKVVVAKSLILLSLWSVGYFICFLTTFIYNSCFWDNDVAKNLGLSILCWWLFGIFIISLISLFSTLFTSSTSVLLGVGGAVLISYIFGLIPKIGGCLPTHLTDGNSLIYGLKSAEDYLLAILITALVSAVSFAVSIPIFNKKQL